MQKNAYALFLSLLTAACSTSAAGSGDAGQRSDTQAALAGFPRFAHVGVSVRDLDKMKAWYQKTFGFQAVVEEFQLPEPPVRTVILQRSNGLRIELIERRGATRPRTFADPLDAASTLGYGHWALAVDDLDRAYEVASSEGGAVWPPAPGVQPGSRFAYVRDPEGNLIELIESPQ